MMMNKWKNRLLLIPILFLLLCGCAATIRDNQDNTETNQIITEIDQDGWYSSKEDVALYLEIYNELPDNYITKEEAYDLGWDSKAGNLWDVAEGMSIGGDKFGNREGLLPEEEGRIYYECDIDYEGGYRNGKRIVFSNDGLIFYTDDHYESFEELTDEDN